MKFNERLMAQMRAATNSLKNGQGSKSATATIQEALKVLSPKNTAGQAQPAPAMRDINAPPSHAQPQSRPETAPQPASVPPRSPMDEVSEVLRNMVPEMMANLDRAGTMSGGSLKMPSFELPGGLNGTLASAPSLPGQFIDGSYSNAAGSRDYKLYVPSTYTSAPMPLVVMLHGCTQDPDDFAKGTQMNLLAEELQCFVVYPAQSQQANPSRCWNWFNEQDQQRGMGEPSIIAGITETIMHNHNVDRSQVYVAGLSAGGAMATIMGTLYPDLYAAVGVHSGLPFASAHDLPSALAAMKGQFGRSASGSKPIPIIVFHGDKDTTVHPANGDELIKQGAHKAARKVVVEPGRVPQGHAYTRTVHHGDDGTAHAEQWLIHGAGHAWSGGSAHGSYTDGKGPDASREMMRFFQTRRA
ncbi:PHB depolymerase family esterase [Massilia sp. CF038]|uniref:extracellular catalytic domain type 1 short-chain-length polyhydroxyalkanoate depolymerase n=1 Tax=Massilia sp. CF038 TaxID=1881045 RepID=UPI0009129F1B|nr:PHB depolymerase family esterase [Massilia sp. CF038]SHH43450.1 esterase, PHB depolymerase family [Massilia sp. CF038]